MSQLLTQTIPPLYFVILAFLIIFLAIAGFLIWYALRRNDQVHAKFAHGKTIFEIETKKHRDAP